MAELWALLHFIMPTLFDSHDEFNEWFSKDIESHAENKTGIDESKYEVSLFHCALTFRHRVSSILGQAFRYSLENAFYIFNQQIYFII